MLKIELNNYETEIADSLLIIIPDIMIKNCGLDSEKVIHDLSDFKNNDGEIDSRFGLDNTIQSLWENDVPVDQAVEKLYQPYLTLLNGQCSIM